MKIEYKSVPCRIKAMGDDGTFELYALAFNNVDRQGDIIIPGAVSNADELVKDGWGALNHQNSALPVAYADEAAQDQTGLLVRGKFHSHPEAQACRTVVRERMEAGKSVSCSIGYVVDDAAYETRNGEPVRILKSIRVYEFSFVNLPANPRATVVSAKSLEAEPMDDAEKGLIAAIKRVVGLDAKKGKPISAANHGTLTNHASGLSATLDAMKEHGKSYKAMCNKMAEQLDDFKAFLDSHAPQDAADDDDGDEGGKAAAPIDTGNLARRALLARRKAECP